MEFPGTLSLSTETFVRAVTEVGMCLVKHGFKHLLILNGHGHNLDPVKLVARNIRDETKGDVLVAAGNYWHFALEEFRTIRESGVGGMAHACEFETSSMLAIRPMDVRMSLAKKHMPVWKTRYFSMDFHVPRNIYVAHHVSDFSPEGVFGDPTLGTAEKGERFLDAAARNIAEFLVEFADWTYSSMFSHEAT
jgi:creatinine amidohydrolase